MSDRLDAVVVGAGQAGLAVSRELMRTGVEHVVLERGRVAETWRGRWESFCLVTPNWSLRLPGAAYDGPDPDGYLPRDELVAYLEGYAGPQVREGVDVAAVRPAPGGGFTLDTSAGRLAARTVVLCTGAYQRPHRPPGAATLPADLPQLDVPEYRSPSALPPGPVLVVGSGQAGCQIAEELHLEGRTVFLACGRAPWWPRRIGGRDMFWWAQETGYLDAPFASLDDPADRLFGNVLATGAGGGRDLHLRTLRRLGVTLLGHLLDARGRHARFAPDLGASVAWGDERHARFAALVRDLAAERGLPAPALPAAEPFDPAAPQQLDLTGFGAVVFAGGFRPDYRSWVLVPGAFDALGFPLHADGVSTAADGLCFAGVHFLRKRKSSLLVGVGEDAAIVADRVAARVARSR